MTEQQDDVLPSTWSRYLIVAALLSGAGSGASYLSTDTGDRYHAGTAKSDFSLRDKSINDLERQVRLHEQHSAKYTQIIEQLEEKLAELKEEVHSHQRGGMHKE